MKRYVSPKITVIRHNSNSEDVLNACKYYHMTILSESTTANSCTKWHNFGCYTCNAMTSS